MKFIEIPHGSSHYQRILVLRDLHLRQPLGLELTTEDTDDEANQRHFMLQDGNEIIAGLIAKTETPDAARFRQMWVHSSHSGQGHGRKLLSDTESLLASEGHSVFKIHARETARGFYLKCGYEPDGTPFDEVGIPHIAMLKTLHS